MISISARAALGPIWLRGYAACILLWWSLLAWAAPAIDPVDPAPRAAFDGGLVARGADLAAIGNCKDCHTAPGAPPYAGGRALKTQFGTIHATNITPDADTGIGRWSEAAFTRAMREGVDREGRHLYPVFPYDHFTKVRDADLKAIYAFLMTREPVRAEIPPNALKFPFNFRSLIGLWKRMYFRPGPWEDDKAQSAEWNRGAYLAHGLAHCGACHTPRNALGAEQKNELFAGGEAEGWHAPALNAASPSPVPWDADRLYAYLRTGVVDLHAVPAGPMAPVMHNLARAPAPDVRAISIYIASTIGGDSQAQKGARATALIADAKDRQLAPAGMRTESSSQSEGATVYAGACGVCHDRGRTLSSAGGLPLGLSIAVSLPTPRNLIHIINDGIVPPLGQPGRFMPAFAGAFTKEQLASLLNYLRTDLGKLPPWENVQDDIVKVMAEKKP